MEHILLGAPEFIMHEDFARIEEEIIPYADKGDRVLLFARYDGENVENGINGSVTPLGFVALANPIRENAVKTFEYFKSQGVAIRLFQVTIRVLFQGLPYRQELKVQKALSMRLHLILRINSRCSK